MKPFSPHWADVTALQIVKSRPDKDQYVLASGITPSGKVHVGNFREVITVDLMARALRSLGKKVRFIYSWDNFDTFRKVPKNLPDPQAFTTYLRQPISRIPDPWQEEATFALGRIRPFERELSKVGICPEYIYQESQYAAGKYAGEIKKALENKDKIIEILNRHRTEPLAEDWLPTSIYCSLCQRDEMDYQRYEGGWDYAYRCSHCQHEEKVDIRKTPNLKLVWRVDWPMRWAYEQVDFEPGGKDHSSQGGSFDTGKLLVQAVWQQQPPTYLQYDFVRIKGGAGKMSSSSGELYTLEEVLQVYEPEIARWIFVNQRPNHDFAIAFDEDVIKIYDEFDRCEERAFERVGDESPKELLNRRTYELSLTTPPSVPWQETPPPRRASFRSLCNRLQICGGDIQRTYARFYEGELSEPENKQKFFSRAERAVHWLKHYAPEEFRYALHAKPIALALNSQQEQAILAIKALVQDVDLHAIDTKALNELIWQKAVHDSCCEPQQAFQAIYQKLIGRDQGPRLPSFLKEIGKEKLLELL